MEHDPMTDQSREAMSFALHPQWRSRLTPATGEAICRYLNHVIESLEELQGDLRDGHGEWIEGEAARFRIAPDAPHVVRYWATDPGLLSGLADGLTMILEALTVENLDEALGGFKDLAAYLKFETECVVVPADAYDVEGTETA